MRAALEGGDGVPGVSAVLGADHDRVYRVEKRPASSKKRTRTPGRLPAARRVVVRDPDEVSRVERGEHGSVVRSVDVGEAHEADPDAHPRPPSVTGEPVAADSVAARPILSAS